MRSTHWMLAVVGVVGLRVAEPRGPAGPAGPAPQSAVGSIAELGWLAGCLESRRGDRVVEEDRMELRAGTMPGVGRTTSSKGMLEYEFTLIRERDGRPVYEAHPSGQPSTTFEATVANGDSVVFAAPAHDYPQIVGYRRAGADSVIAWIDGTVQGRSRRIEFPYRRVACAGDRQPG